MQLIIVLAVVEVRNLTRRRPGIGDNHSYCQLHGAFDAKRRTQVYL